MGLGPQQTGEAGLMVAWGLDIDGVGSSGKRVGLEGGIREHICSYSSGVTIKRLYGRVEVEHR